MSTGTPGTGARLLVAIPCLDEAPTIGTVVENVPRSIAGFASVDVLVIDDGSSDGTGEIARRAGAEVLRHPVNQGLGVSFRSAVATATARGYDVLVNIDGDGQFDPADIPKLTAPVLAGHAQMATASRFADPELIPKMLPVKLWGNRQVARLVRILSGQRFHDVSCGFRAFSRDALLRMNLFGTFTYTQETFLDLIFRGLRILEVPVKVRGVREFGRSKMASSIPRYAFRSARIMMRTFIAYRPLAFFGALAGLFLATGTALLLFLLWHYLRTGAFTPHIWAGFLGGSLGMLGISTLVTGVLSDLMLRLQRTQEEALYLLRAGRSVDRT